MIQDEDKKYGGDWSARSGDRVGAKEAQAGQREPSTFKRTV